MTNFFQKVSQISIKIELTKSNEYSHGMNSLPALEGFLNYLEYQIVENSEFKNLVREFYITFLGVDIQEELKR